VSSFSFLFRLVAVAALFLAAASSARAQGNTRSWVSGTGDDAFPCTRTEPCKTYAGAHAKTARDGIISVLDPGGYGSVTITKSITIDGTGTLASSLSAGVDGLTINITDAADTRKAVRLRNIEINGASTGLNGIKVLAASNVHVEGCVIDGFTGNGIEMTADGAALHVSRTTIRQVQTAIRLMGDINATIDSCKLENNRANGLEVWNGTHATISNSVVSHNARDALVALRSAYINAADNVIAHNGGAGVRAKSFTAFRLAGNSIFENDIGIAVEINASVASDGTNRVGGNNSTQMPNATLASM
jgi:Right handed beta helix region